jgi:hypothetical protein
MRAMLGELTLPRLLALVAGRERPASDDEATVATAFRNAIRALPGRPLGGGLAYAS